MYQGRDDWGEGTMRVVVELTVNIDDPDRVIGEARDQYVRDGASIDVDGMTDEEALAVCHLSLEESQRHPRCITPDAAIPDAPTAAMRLATRCLQRLGIEVESSSACMAESERAEPARGGRRRGLDPLRTKPGSGGPRRQS